MNKYLKIVLFGFLTWLIPFAVSFVVFPFKASNRGLFETVMAVTVTAVAVIFASLYLNKVPRGFTRAGVLIGVAWFFVNIVIDLLLFLPPSPMQMSFPDYMTDIGFTYLIYPIVSIGCGYLLDWKGATRG
jgi:uncharacterized membrane protein YpjA